MRPCSCPDRRGPYALALADLDKDRQLDIIVGFVESPGAVYFNRSKGTDFREVPWNDGKGVVYGMVFGDIDGDSWPDIIVARSDAPNAIWFGKSGR